MATEKENKIGVTQLELNQVTKDCERLSKSLQESELLIAKVKA